MHKLNDKLPDECPKCGNEAEGPASLLWIGPRYKAADNRIAWRCSCCEYEYEVFPRDIRPKPDLEGGSAVCPLCGDYIENCIRNNRACEQRAAAQHGRIFTSTDLSTETVGRR